VLTMLAEHRWLGGELDGVGWPCRRRPRSRCWSCDGRFVGELLVSLPAGGKPMTTLKRSEMPLCLINCENKYVLRPASWTSKQLA
jgi:hypothetical protein